MAIVDWADGLKSRARVLLTASVALLLAGNAVALASYQDSPDRSAPSPGRLLAGVAPEGPNGDAAGAELSAATKGGSSAPQAPTAAQGQAGGSVPPGATPPGPRETRPPQPPYTYKVTLEPTCVAVGQDFTATFHLEPGAAVVAVAVHADGQTHETRWGTNAGPDGKAVRTWTAPPAPGPGKLLTGAMIGGGRSGGTMVEFRIVELPGTC